MSPSCFAALLSGGMLVLLSFCRLKDISWRFLRLVGMLCTGMMIWIVVDGVLGPGSSRDDPWTLWRTPGLVLTSIGGMGAFILMALAPLHERISGILRSLCIAAGSASVLAGCLLWRLEGADRLSLSTLVMIFLSLTLGAGMLGSVTLAWLLGHAYLTATRMTIAPLKHLVRVYCAIVIFRMVFFSLGMAWVKLGEHDLVAGCLSSAWLLVLLRVAAGLLAPAAFGTMVLACVKWRNTQAATGILYFASVLTYVGELCSLYLTTELGWPI